MFLNLELTPCIKCICNTFNLDGASLKTEYSRQEELFLL